jgi:glyoxylase-like metal-dependent hydrolase (beta-lactamase superfamily II)
MPLTTHRLNLGPLDNNTWLLIDDATRETAVMDAGFEADVVLERLRALDVRVTRLLLTHAHYDHACGMLEVQRAHPVPCWLHPADRPLLAALARQGEAFGLPPVEPPGDLRDLEDGQTLALGESALEVIHTPGHSPGGVCFRHGGDLWVGDTLFAGSIGRTDLPGGSFEALDRSIRTRLYPLGDSVRCHPGHGPSTTIGIERRSNPFVGEGATFA